jgi:hypothetical protein
MVILQASAFLHLFVIVLIALCTYGIVPGIGAFFVRRKWRRFREGLLSAASYPVPDYRLLHSGESGRAGCFRFYGTLRALRGENGAWVDNGRVSLRVELERVRVYMISAPSSLSHREGSSAFDDEMVPIEVPWRRIKTLPEGTKVFVAGELDRRATGALFLSTQKVPLVVIVYDGPDEHLLSHAVKTGRERNGYWNFLTPGALTTGSFTLFVYFYLLLRAPLLRFPAILALTVSLLPLTLVLPPAVIGYSFYRSLWKRAFLLRTERDLLTLNEISEGKKAPPKEAEVKKRTSQRLELLALLILALSVGVELFMIFIFFAAVIR